MSPNPHDSAGRRWTISAFHKGESQQQIRLRRLEGARLFALLSSPSHVERLLGFRSSWILGAIHEGAPCCRLRCERSKPTPKRASFYNALIKWIISDCCPVDPLRRLRRASFGADHILAKRNADVWLAVAFLFGPKDEVRDVVGLPRCSDKLVHRFHQEL
jgi:hypothetical protein